MKAFHFGPRQIFISIFVFLMSENPDIPNFKGRRQIRNFQKSRRVDPKTTTCGFLIAIMMVLMSAKPDIPNSKFWCTSKQFSFAYSY